LNKCLLQDQSLLIGSRESIDCLAQKDSARILAISDSHANANALSFVLQKFGMESDLLLFCGDGVSDIVYLLQKASEDQYFFACIPPVIAFVKGNNDSSSYTFMNKAAFAKNSGSPLVKIAVPLQNELTVCGHKILLVHGHAHSLYSGVSYLVQEAENCGAEILFFGHTHIPACGCVSCNSGKSSLLLLNPGSCSIPRACQPASFAVLELKKDRALADYTFYEIRHPEPRPFVPPPIYMD